MEKMLKNLSRLECKIGEKVYQLMCDMDSPLEHVKEALFQFSKYIGSVEDSVKAQQSSQEKQKEPEIDQDEESKVD